MSRRPWGLANEKLPFIFSQLDNAERIFFVEPAVYDAAEAWLETTEAEGGVQVVRMHLHPDAVIEEEVQAHLLHQLLRWYAIEDYVLWSDLPRAVSFMPGFEPLEIIQDRADTARQLSDTLRA
jgi:hypothetical protein